MGKQGPCCHCGISTTPLWRNGPPEKPVLCNACGSRWRTKGTLLNYMPMHSGGCGINDSPDYKWPRGKRGPQKFKEQRSHKRKEPCDIHRDAEFRAMKSNLQYAKILDEDASTRSSSVSGITNSEGCMQHGCAAEKDNTVHISVWDSPVPSKKRTCMFRQRPSSVEKFTKGMQYMLQEQDSSYLSSSSEEDLLYEYKPPPVAVEIGLGSVFIRQPHSGIKEEESEASSLLIENKGCNTFDVLTQAYSGAMFPPGHLPDGDNIVTETWKQNMELLQEHSATSFIPNNALLESFLRSCHSPLIFMDLKDIVNFDTFTELLKDEEQMQLLQYVSTVDDSAVPESLKCMFASVQFKGALCNFQQLLSEGMFDMYGSGLSPQVQQLFQQLLMVTDLTKSKWMDRYSHLRHWFKRRGLVDSSKHPESKDATKPKGPNLLGSLPISAVHAALKDSSGRPPPGHSFGGSEKDKRSSVRLQRSGCATVYPLTPTWANSSTDGRCYESIDTGSTSKEAVGFGAGPKSGPFFSPNRMFDSPLQRCSSFVLDSSGNLADESSDSVLLFDVPSNLSFPQAELLHAPSLKCKAPKDIADANNLEIPSSGGPTVNNTWNSEDNLDWGGLLWDPSYAGSGQTLPNGPVLDPGVAILRQ